MITPVVHHRQAPRQAMITAAGKPRSIPRTPTARAKATRQKMRDSPASCRNKRTRVGRATATTAEHLPTGLRVAPMGKLHPTASRASIRLQSKPRESAVCSARSWEEAHLPNLAHRSKTTDHHLSREAGRLLKATPHQWVDAGKVSMVAAIRLSRAMVVGMDSPSRVATIRSSSNKRCRRRRPALAAWVLWVRVPWVWEEACSVVRC